MKSHPLLHFQSGLTLIELMVASTLSMFIVLSVTGLIISAKAAQAVQHNASNMQDTARFVLNNLSHSIKQAGYVNFDSKNTVIFNTENRTPSIIGLNADNLSLHGVDFSIPTAAYFNDILAVRFFRSDHSSDNTLLNCAGLEVTTTTSQHGADEDLGWNIYYVATDTNHKPSLFCKYKNQAKTFATQSIASGVQSFQVWYSLTVNSSQQFLSSEQIDALDADIPASELNRNTHWKKITAVKISMLINETEQSHRGADSSTLKKVVSTTIQLRNPLR